MVLHMGRNKIDVIPPEIGNMKELVVLNLFSNLLTDLPQELAQISAFVKEEFIDEEEYDRTHPQLLLSYNKFAEIPSVLYKLTALEELNLSGNYLTEIPEKIQLLHSLRFLSIPNNLSDKPLTISPATARIQNLIQFHSFHEAQMEQGGSDELKKTIEDISKIPSLTEIEVSEVILKDEGSHTPQQIINPDQFNGGDLDKSNMKCGVGKLIGNLRKNEDTTVIAQSILPNIDLYGLFDGHGGKEASQYSRNNVVRIFKETMRACDGDLGQCAKILFGEINKQMERYFEAVEKERSRSSNEKQKSLNDMGTTAVVCIVQTDTKQVYSINAGDSRAVLGRRNGDVVRITLDHKPSLSGELSRVRKVGGFIMNEEKGYRAARAAPSMLALGVVRGLGDFSSRPIITEEPYIHPPFAYDCVPSPTDTFPFDFLILGSDGLWDLVSDKDAVKVAKSLPSPFQSAMKLRDFSYLMRSGDDISVIVVHLK
eukprot:TRINITY_DN9604_c0_g1_i1.p1 TRINITY_DN9604_c0_g1~~TRINITY_DN9604_c0_g1_i1.p1  ORF type:complete len:483 (+),score=167.57 TRINITY_DN9604_c0_g1_i1:565-2013(+)